MLRRGGWKWVLGVIPRIIILVPLYVIIVIAIVPGRGDRRDD